MKNSSNNRRVEPRRVPAWVLPWVIAATAAFVLGLLWVVGSPFGTAPQSDRTYGSPFSSAPSAASKAPKPKQTATLAEQCGYTSEVVERVWDRCAIDGVRLHMNDKGVFTQKNHPAVPVKISTFTHSEFTTRDMCLAPKHGVAVCIVEEANSRRVDYDYDIKGGVVPFIDYWTRDANEKFRWSDAGNLNDKLLKKPIDITLTWTIQDATPADVSYPLSWEQVRPYYQLDSFNDKS